MKQLVELNSLPLQNYIVATENNDSFNFSLQFVDNQAGWFYSIQYGTFILNGRRLVNSPNILHQFKNILPFGIAVVTADLTDPFDINDFTNGRVLVYLLTQTEVLQVESTIF